MVDYDSAATGVLAQLLGDLRRVTSLMLRAAQADDWAGVAAGEEERCALLVCMSTKDVSPREAADLADLLRELMTLDSQVLEVTRRKRAACAALLQGGRRAVTAAGEYRKTAGWALPAANTT